MIEDKFLIEDIETQKKSNMLFNIKNNIIKLNQIKKNKGLIK